MTTKKEEEVIVTGLESAHDKKEAEYDLVAALLEAAAFNEDLTPVDITRNGKVLFTVHIHPLSDDAVKVARKRATVMMNNPQNRKLPKIEKEFNTNLFNSLIIYAATSEEDQKNIWGNKAIMDKYDLVEPHESINVLLPVGAKSELTNKVIEISGMSDEDEEVTTGDYTKN